MEQPEIYQFVDPEVSKIKFQSELEEFIQQEVEYRKRGIVCITKEEFSISLLFAVPNLIPPPIAFAVKVLYNNWDIEPPSIKFINPFSGVYLLKREDIKISFLQKNKIEVNDTGPQEQFSFQDLVQGGFETMDPFFCVPGVREYHNHPAHSGNSWLLYRTKGEGKLCVLIDQLYRHSIALAGSYQFQFQMPPLNINAPISIIAPDPNKIK